MRLCPNYRFLRNSASPIICADVSKVVFFFHLRVDAQFRWHAALFLPDIALSTNVVIGITAINNVHMHIASHNFTNFRTQPVLFWHRPTADVHWKCDLSRFLVSARNGNPGRAAIMRPVLYGSS